MPIKPTIFISYSHRDERAKNELLSYIKVLEVHGTLQTWDDRNIDVGDDWYEEIQDKLQSCAVAVLLISENFLSSSFCTKHEVPVLLKRRKSEGMLLIPVLVRQCPWKINSWLKSMQVLPRDEISTNSLGAAKRGKLYSEIAYTIHQFLELGGISNNATVNFNYGGDTEVDWPPLADHLIDIDRLPTSGLDLIGRESELQVLDEALNGGSTNIVELVAWGGVGKSTLVRKWCELLRNENFRGAKRVFGWSFFSQGSSDRVSSADGFMEAALRFFGDPDPVKGSPWAKGERLAELVGRQTALLILDGLEPLQDSHQGIKDPALSRLIKELSVRNTGLCVITTRETVIELKEFPGTSLSMNLEQLSKEAGRAILRIKGVRGRDNELEEASESFGNNALALSLLSSYVVGVEGRHISRAKDIPDISHAAFGQGRHARRIMSAFARRFGSGPSLELLSVLGLFDRPAAFDCIQALCMPPGIPGLTEHLFLLSERDWIQLVFKLRSFGLIAESNQEALEYIDAHPLVREHFGEELKKSNLKAWQAGHSQLYEHLRATSTVQPDILSEMQPLLQAVHHGCEAGRRVDVLNEVFRERLRDNNRDSGAKFGAYGADLSALSSFFKIPFTEVSDDLSAIDQAFVLNEVAFNLRALGRLQDAIDLQRLGVERDVALELWGEASTNACNVVELLMALGRIAEAITAAEAAVIYAERSGDWVRQVVSYTRLGAAKHQAGAVDQASILFAKAETLHAENESKLRILSRLAGYRYGDLLIDLNRPDKAWDRAELIVEENQTRSNHSLLDVALGHLALGCAGLSIGKIPETQQHLEQAVEGLRRAGTIHHIPRGLLARAALYRRIGSHGSASRDLDEVTRIAQRTGMLLFECDANLERARLALAMEKEVEARAELAQAKAIIGSTGYHRRDKEAAELASVLKWY